MYYCGNRSFFYTELVILGSLCFHVFTFYNCWSIDLNIYTIIIFCCANFNGFLKYVQMLIIMITYIKTKQYYIFIINTTKIDLWQVWVWCFRKFLDWLDDVIQVLNPTTWEAKKGEWLEKWGRPRLYSKF